MQQKLKCIAHNQGLWLCRNSQCKFNPIMCNDVICQCFKNHSSCLDSIRIDVFNHHLIQLNKGLSFIEFFKTSMYEHLQKLRKEVNVMIDTQIQNVNNHLRQLETEDVMNVKQISEGKQLLTGKMIEKLVTLKQLTTKQKQNDYQLLVNRLKNNIDSILINMRKQLSCVLKNHTLLDFDEHMKGSLIHLKSINSKYIQFQHKGNMQKHQDIILPKSLTQTTKLFIHFTHLITHDHKSNWAYVGIANKTHLNFDSNNHTHSISVSTKETMHGGLHKLHGNGLQLKNQCLFQLQYNIHHHYLVIKTGSNVYRADNLPRSDYHIIIGMLMPNSTVRIYE